MILPLEHMAWRGLFDAYDVSEWQKMGSAYAPPEWPEVGLMDFVTERRAPLVAATERALTSAKTSDGGNQNGHPLSHGTV